MKPRLTIVMATLAACMSVAHARPQCPAGMTASDDGKACTSGRTEAASSPGSFDVLGNIMDTTKNEVNARQAIANSKQEFLESDFHKKHIQGYWDFFQASSSAKPGEYCTAMFLRDGMAVAILGPGGKYRGALMLFLPLVDNEKFPKSKEARVIPVTLQQAQDAPVTVGAFNFAIGAWDGPAIGLAVPTIEAALAGMDEKLDFRLDYDGGRIVEIEWHSGTVARDSLKKCLAGG